MIENLVTKQMGVRAALQVKLGQKKLADFGYALRQRAKPFLELPVQSIKLKLEIEERAEEEISEYMSKWLSEPGRLGFGPHTSKCYLSMYRNMGMFMIRKKTFAR